MSDRRLASLARAAGIAVRWTDATGAQHTVPDDTLRAILSALSLPAANDGDVKDSIARSGRHRSNERMIVVEVGKPFPVSSKGRLAVVAEDGKMVDLTISNGRAIAPSVAGYYTFSDGEKTLAVAPRRAFGLSDVSGEKMWGVAVQLYSLRGGTTEGFGDFAALADLCEAAAKHGADAVAISPIHALFSSDLSRYAPYSPSTRLFINARYATAPDGKAAHANSSSLIDWPANSAAKMATLKSAQKATLKDKVNSNAFANFVEADGEALLAYARFEVLDARFRKQGIYGWNNWPAEYSNSKSSVVSALGQDDSGVAFQLFLQWLANKSLKEAQETARTSGMKIGLITDVAVGVDPAGGQAWSAPDEMLRGLSIGAPPDAYNANGQNWGLTTFSPQGLIASGYDGFIRTLRASMRHAGGIRLDHAMGLERLWVVPRGAPPTEGAYLHYPIDALMGLLRLESQRHKAIVVAEDLGTVPNGFRERLKRARLSGMRVLWFERDSKRRFKQPADWDAAGAALTTTHDLPTIAGWWSGRDIAWRAKTGTTKADTTRAKKERETDKRLLWQAFRKARCTNRETRPTLANVVDAGLRFTAKTTCPLALVPIEDLVAAREQPNLPGTIDEHPNWRRRLKSSEPFQSQAVKRRALAITLERKR
jgi:4-alpha-glucanotransferase